MEAASKVNKENRHDFFVFGILEAYFRRKCFMNKGLNYMKEIVKGRIGRSKAAKSEEGLQPGQGKVVLKNGKQIAVFKDAAGNVTRLSAVCMHLGCIVDFNGKEKTWDCPCHGSRYNTDGSIINGPTKKPLKKVK